MADLEERAIRRDKRFLVRLVLMLLAGALVGAVLYRELTSPGVGGCAAQTFGGVSGTADGGVARDR